MSVFSPYAKRFILFSSNPSSPVEGQVYGDSVSHVPKYYNGSSWLTLQTTATTPGGSNTQVQYNNSNAFGGSSGITLTATQATISSAGLKFSGATSGTVTVSAPSVAGTRTLAWPATNGDIYAGSSLTTNTLPKVTGAGILGDSKFADNGTSPTYNSLPMEVMLSTTTVDLTVGTKQTLYTVPAAKHLIVTKIIVRSASADVSLYDGSLNFVIGVGESDVGSVVPTLTDSTHYIFGIIANVPPIGAAGDVLGVFSGDTSITATVIVEVFGYLY
jgi:hypothetical protein